jgi:hypothetical protein
MVAGAILIAFGTVTSTMGLFDEYRLHTSGTPALKSRMENGICHERAIYNCELDAQYITSDGTEHTRHQEYFTFFQKPDTDKRFLVRYDPAAPQHISTTWGAGLLINRTITTLLGWLLVVGLVATFIGSIGSKGRQRRALDAIGAQPTPIEAKFVKAYSAPSSPSATLTYTWTDSTGILHTGSSELFGARDPFWLDASKSRMLAVAGPDNKTYLFDAQLQNVSLTPQERAQLIAARDRSLQTA